ncbi:hypothetical protein WR25_08044 [Diploscapter pachys]|uniref:Uncharacterized protein n=1 Tax=Diploscapter pachys TaxID=2018661 RepID=A0A2A2M408_9BILA|nr:hypothetical protein WR25_08044 [Diploscapter pachys]
MMKVATRIGSWIGKLSSVRRPKMVLRKLSDIMSVLRTGHGGNAGKGQRIDRGHAAVGFAARLAAAGGLLAGGVTVRAAALFLRLLLQRPLRVAAAHVAGVVDGRGMAHVHPTVLHHRRLHAGFAGFGAHAQDAVEQAGREAGVADRGDLFARAFQLQFAEMPSNRPGLFSTACNCVSMPGIV